MNNYLFLFTLGPVQSFISQARKTRDLYAGSQLLSKLIKKAMDAFKNEFEDGEIIFPYYAEGAGASYPNRFVARVENLEGELKEYGVAIERAVRDEWRKIAKEAIDKNAKIDGYWRDQYFKQIDDFLNIYWLFVPLNDDYSTAYNTLERMGGAIKNIRPFEQFPERGIKCSLDGQYNAIFFSPENKRTYQGVWVNNPFLIGKSEGLSAVSFVKRCQEVAFPSTSHVALMEDFKKLDEEESYVLDCFKKLFKKEWIASTCIELFKRELIKKARVENSKNEKDWCEEYDSHFLFEENLNEKNIINKNQRELLQELHSRLRKKLKTRYYAVVMFDGDQMGKWLSGEFLNEYGKSNLDKFHLTLSKALSEYAKWAKEFLNEENSNGHAIYAGGDDFLGFVNVHCLFDVLMKLRSNFDNIVNQQLNEQGFISEKKLTFSAGIVIAHYKMPFSEVLKKVRIVEKKAKEEGDRNAFAIAVMKHSGEIHETVYKWDADSTSPSGTSNLNALKHIYEQVDLEESGGKFSNTFIQVLTKELQSLLGWQLQKTANIKYAHKEESIVETEVLRLVKRSSQMTDKDEIKETIKDMKEKVVQLYKAVPSNSDFGPRHFVHALQIADFLKRKTTDQV